MDKMFQTVKTHMLNMRQTKHNTNFVLTSAIVLLFTFYNDGFIGFDLRDSMNPAKSEDIIDYLN